MRRENIWNVTVLQRVRLLKLVRTGTLPEAVLKSVCKGRYATSFQERKGRCLCLCSKRDVDFRCQSLRRLQFMCGCASFSVEQVVCPVQLIHTGVVPEVSTSAIDSARSSEV
jgi:hypothetical protein